MFFDGDNLIIKDERFNKEPVIETENIPDSASNYTT
jgi:hypothetical protein